MTPTAGWPRWAFEGGRPNGENRDKMTGLAVLEDASRILDEGRAFVAHTSACWADGRGCIPENPEAARWSLQGALWRAWWDGEGAAWKRGEVQITGVVGAGWVWARYWTGQAAVRLVNERPGILETLHEADRIPQRMADGLGKVHGWGPTARILALATEAERANDLPLD